MATNVHTTGCMQSQNSNLVFSICCVYTYTGSNISNNKLVMTFVSEYDCTSYEQMYFCSCCWLGRAQRRHSAGGTAFYLFSQVRIGGGILSLSFFFF